VIENHGCRGLKVGESEEVLVGISDCGGWRGMGLTPLWHAQAGYEQSFFSLSSKAVSRPTCHRSPKES